nr:efflux RND transporter permease subunit [Candidatus Kapabacteria bacterium]
LMLITSPIHEFEPKSRKYEKMRSVRDLPDKWGAVYDGSRLTWFVFFEWTIACTMSLVEGISAMCSDSRSCCTPPIIIIVACAILEFLVIAWKNPFLVYLDKFVNTPMALANAILAVVVTIGFFTETWKPYDPLLLRVTSCEQHN